MRCVPVIVGLTVSAWARLLLAAPSLLPTGPSRSPDYLCTWNLQGYVCSYAGSPTVRRVMVEQNIFGHGKYQDWIDLYPSIRGSLFLVLDDAWDVPLDGDRREYGSLALNRERFPTARPPSGCAS